MVSKLLVRGYGSLKNFWKNAAKKKMTLAQALEEYQTNSPYCFNFQEKIEPHKQITTK